MGALGHAADPGWFEMCVDRFLVDLYQSSKPRETKRRSVPRQIVLAKEPAGQAASGPGSLRASDRALTPHADKG